jgi:uncharacterized membrane protein YkoI
MSQRTALFVATGLTVFVLIMMVGVVGQLFLKSNVDALAVQPAAPTQVAAVIGETQAVNGPTDAQIAQRDAAFQQLIQQANQRLAQANQKEQELAKQLEEQKQAAPAPAPMSLQPKYTVTPDQAASIAQEAEKGAVLLKQPELVSYQGTVAYEVTLDRGMVYVDANTGKVLYDSAVVITIHDGGGPSNGGGGGNTSVASSSNHSSGEHNDDHHESGDSHESGGSHEGGGDD